MESKQDDNSEATAATQQLIQAVVRDMVDISVICRSLLEKGTFALEDFDEVHLANEMCNEILSRFTKDNKDA